MDISIGWQTLPDFEDRVLYHIADLAGDLPVGLEDMISDIEVVERLAGELGIDVSSINDDQFFRSKEYQPLRQAILDLRDSGKINFRGTLTSTHVSPTRQGRDKVRAWRKSWEQQQPKREQIIQNYILKELDRQRRANPLKYKRESRIDIETFTAKHGIELQDYLIAGQRLLDQNKVMNSAGKVMGKHVGTGHLAITEAGISALESLGTASSSPSPTAQQAWQEVAKLRKQLLIAETNPTSLISDEELKRRCLELLSADSDYDRAIREACVVLEDRVRSSVSNLGLDVTELVGVKLMHKAFASTEKNPFLQLSTHAGEQQGAMGLYAGIMGYIRNPTGHRLSNSYTQATAIRIVVFVDFLLGEIKKVTISTT